MKKILFLSANFPPMMTSGASRAFRIASMLPENGWQPLVAAPADIVRSGTDGISQQHAYPLFRAGESVDSDAFGPERVEQLLQGMTVSAPAGAALRMISGLLPGVNLAAQWEKLAPAIAAEILGGNEQVDAIYAQGPGRAPLALALELAEKYRLPVLFDLVSPLEIVASGGKSDAARMEERILTSGHAVITPTRALKEHFLKKYFGKVTHDDITIIPDFCVLPDSPRGAGAQLPVGQSGLIVLFSDVSPKDLKVFMSALGRFLSNAGVLLPSVSFIGGDRRAIEKYARKYLSSISSTIMYRLSDREELEHIGRCSMFGVVLGSNELSRLTIPERLVDAACMGKFLFVVGPDGPASRLAVDCGGFSAPLQEVGQIVQLLDSMLESAKGFRGSATGMSGTGKFSSSQAIGDLSRLLAFMLPL